MTHEEALSPTTSRSREVRSYRDLPLILYHLQTKERDEPRPRAGVLRTREFTMKDSYSFDRDAEGLDRSYELHIEAYDRIFDRCGLQWYRVASDVGMMGGSGAHEYMAPCAAGENEVALADGYAANVEVASAEPQPVELPAGTDEPEAVMPPRADLCRGGLRVPRTGRGGADQGDAHHGRGRRHGPVPPAITGSTRSSCATTSAPTSGRPARRRSPSSRPRRLRRPRRGEGPGAQGRSDPRRLLDRDRRQPARQAPEGRRARPRLRVRGTPTSARSRAGDTAPGGATIEIQPAIEIGNIFKLGTRYSEPLGATYLDEEGKEQPIVMGSYGIGPARIAAAAIEQGADEAPGSSRRVDRPWASTSSRSARRARPRGRGQAPSMTSCAEAPARSSTTTATRARARSSPTPSCSAARCGPWSAPAARRRTSSRPDRPAVPKTPTSASRTPPPDVAVASRARRRAPRPDDEGTKGRSAGAASGASSSSTAAPPPNETRPGEPLNPWTIPNAIGYVRLAGIPVFLVLAFESGDGLPDGAAAIFWLIAAGDYFDGFVAPADRSVQPQGGPMLDPLVDRLTDALRRGRLLALRPAAALGARRPRRPRGRDAHPRPARRPPRQ